MKTPRSEAEVAFIAAAAVLVALPLLAALGLAALALTKSAGIVPGLAIIPSEKAWMLFAVWVGIAVVAVLVFAVRFIRRST